MVGGPEDDDDEEEDEVEATDNDTDALKRDDEPDTDIENQQQHKSAFRPGRTLCNCSSIIPIHIRHKINHCHCHPIRPSKPEATNSDTRCIAP